MQAGKLQHYVTFQKRVVDAVRDEIGGEVESWPDFKKKWVGMRQLSTKEVFEAAQLQAKVSHLLWGRYDGTLTRLHRIQYGLRIFHIVSITNPDERRRKMEIRCMEELK